MIPIPAHRGASSRDDPVGGAGSGVPRVRLVTAGSGGPVPRPPGTTTWPRGARCTEPEAMPEKEARDPAQNRHGGAPRGARPASWDAGTPLGARPAASWQANRCRCTGAPVGAPPTPHRGGKSFKPRAQSRRGNKGARVASTRIRRLGRASIRAFTPVCAGYAETQRFAAPPVVVGSRKNSTQPTAIRYSHCRV
jgi:hypothetical protein